MAENIGEISLLGYLEEKTLANKLQIKYKNLIICKFEGENFGNWPSIYQILQCLLPPTLSLYSIWHLYVCSMNPSISFNTETA